MPGKVPKIGTFSDWVGLFHEWRKEVGVDRDTIKDFHFDTLYGAIETEEITFGYYKGRRKWENMRQIPTQNMRDALMNLIVYQGDTEFASVEQQRYLFESAPTDWDRSAITRVMIEEMRHGWQMCALLIEFFGDTGKVEAKKMLERRAYENKRLLGSFNEECDNWLDFFAFTDFVDRDGKFQLQMLKYSAFAPLGRSMSYMLKEEAFHMGTGNTGLARIAEAGVVPHWLMQKYLNKWISSSYDLFGTDHSSSAHWAYVWGLKGRYDEPANPHPANLEDLNDYNRHLYRDECATLVRRAKAGERRTLLPEHQVPSQHRTMERPVLPSAERGAGGRKRVHAATGSMAADTGGQETPSGHHRLREEVDRAAQRQRPAADHRGSAQERDQCGAVKKLLATSR
jgi:1,2-phenylacetyl-CoA epoxidase catalytic subunit